MQDDDNSLTSHLLKIAGSPASPQQIVIATKKEAGKSRRYLAFAPYKFSAFPDRAYVFRDREQARLVIKMFPKALAGCVTHALRPGERNRSERDRMAIACDLEDDKKS
jgi:hypothetical protein